ncbi:subtilisin-like protease [Fusarium avenaceum]|nr:subtilisin-like protease [Fusarium avenaceum]
MNMFSWLGASAPICDTKDLSQLLEQILPAFNTVAERVCDDLRDVSDDKLLANRRTSYTHFNVQFCSLQGVFEKWNIADTFHRSSEAEQAEIKKNMMKILDELENVFQSRKNTVAAEAFERLGFERRQGEVYPRLRALSRVLRGNVSRDNQFLCDIDCIICIHRKRGNEERLDRKLKAAADFFLNLKSSITPSDFSCPIRLSDYPLKGLRLLADELFRVLHESWSCRCHINRQTRLNLTQHQQFQTSPAWGDSLPREARFRVLFLNGYCGHEWQDADICVYNRDLLQNFDQKVQNRFCQMLQAVEMGAHLRMAVYRQTLWELRAGIDTNQSFVPQIRSDQFTSLRDLLQPIGRDRKSLISSASLEHRLILSFVLATSFLHFYNGPWMPVNLTNKNICFLMSRRRTLPDITKPFLNANICDQRETSPETSLNQPHPCPGIRALGELLFEIALGTPINIDKSQSSCWEIINRAIEACVDPNKFGAGILSRPTDQPESIKDFINEVRKHIFEKVLYRLQEALDKSYRIKVDTLHSYITDKKEKFLPGSFDHEDENEPERVSHRQDLARTWYQHLSGVHDLVYGYEDKCSFLGDDVRRSTLVKVAVLDTGLQLSEELQENYIDAGRIDTSNSHSFVTNTGESVAEDWKVDCDQHGSRVGQIILDVCPKAVLHVAKVFRSREDLANPVIAEQVHERISKAIDHATNEWKVDMIVMCFGFDKSIPAIDKAIDNAIKTGRAPLFFAATRNDGANKTMAWPARDLSIIGISSATGEGLESTFNTSEEDVPVIFHALGEGVPLGLDSFGRPDKGTKYVSGTSYATPVAAGLVSNLLSCVRMAVEICPSHDRHLYDHIPEALREMKGMLKVMSQKIQTKHARGDKSLAPWDFLSMERLGKRSILEEVDDVLKKS